MTLVNKTKTANSLSFLTIAAVLMICTSIPAEENHLNKLINAQEVMSGFIDGHEKVKVLVSLAEPSELRPVTDWKKPQTTHLFKAEIANRQTTVLSTLTSAEFDLRHRYKNISGFSGEVTAEGLEKLLKNPLVTSVEPVKLLYPHLAQGIPLINATSYRSIYNGQGVAIAVCDTGIDYTHPRLGNGGFPNSKVIGGYDTGDNDSNPMPNGQAHGTCCAGIAAGNLGTSGDYIGGVAYNAKLYALKISFGSGGSAYIDDIIEAWDWCISHQYDNVGNPILVISFSFGGGEYSSPAQAEADNPLLAAAAGRVVAAGITILASSGNDGLCSGLGAPAAFANVISVGAVYDSDIGRNPPTGWVGCISSNSCVGYTSGCPCPGKCYIDYTTAPDQVTTYSNSADFLDVFAPSENAYTTDIKGSSGYSSGDYYSKFGGTSAACPYAAGTAACIQSAAKENTGSYLSPSEIRDLLVSTGDDVTDDKNAITKPRINFGQAIKIVESQIPPSAFDVNVTATFNSSTDITLQASDDGKPKTPGVLSYIITSLPAAGNLSDPQAGSINQAPYTLVNNGNIVTYTPEPNYIGPDQFTYKVNDGGTPPDGGDSNKATVNIKVVIFYDDFPSATLNSLNWPSTFGSPSVDADAQNEPSPPYSLHLERTESVTSKAIDLSICPFAKLQYFWQRYDTEVGDDLYVDYWDGYVWQELATHFYDEGSTTEFTEESIMLPADALHQEFRVRFQADCTRFSDEWFVDNVDISCFDCDMEPPTLEEEPDITKGTTNTISWSQVEDADEYFAVCARDANFTNTVAGTGWIYLTEHTFTNLKLGDTYFYRVKARTEPDITTFSQTTQAEFEADVLIDANATADGNVVLAGTPGSYVSTGTITSVQIDLPALCQWDTVTFTQTTPDNTELYIDIIDANDPCEPVILSDIAWGQDLSALVQTKIKLQAELFTDDTTKTPVLHDWSVDYVDTTTFCESDFSNAAFSVQCGIEGDFQPDCVVDSNDLFDFSLEWLNVDCNDIAGDQTDWCSGTDITQNGIVDFDDYVRMAHNWMICIGPFCE
jgi:subtilisin family serine protease